MLSEKTIIKEIGNIKDKINEQSVKNSNWTTESIATAGQSITDIEIAEIEQAQMLTDHDIAIIELQQKIGG